MRCTSVHDIGLGGQEGRLDPEATPTRVRRVVPTHTEDSHAVAATAGGPATFIATGDRRDLLPMVGLQRIPIVIAREAIEWPGARRET